MKWGDVNHRTQQATRLAFSPSHAAAARALQRGDELHNNTDCTAASPRGQQPTAKVAGGGSRYSASKTVQLSSNIQ